MSPTLKMAHYAHTEDHFTDSDTMHSTVCQESPTQSYQHMSHRLSSKLVGREHLK